MRLSTVLIAAAVLFVLFVALVPRWRLPGAGTQLGADASSMVQWAPTPGEAAGQNRRPPVLPVVADDKRPAGSVYKNVSVLGGLNAGDFLRLQYAMTAWVSPKQGCGFCHAGNDFASDAVPAKQASRVMLAMTRHINASWRGHVGAGGVTCYSCHQGQPIPSNVWFQSPPSPNRAMIDKQEDYAEDAETVGNFFPNEGYEEYLLQDTPGVAQSYSALPTGQAGSQILVKRLYEMMMQMSEDLGVNCGYCHNSRAFFDWRQSTPARWSGYSGIQMTRDINRNYLLEAAKAVPQNRVALVSSPGLALAPSQAGPKAGNGFANCGTCHHGAPKPASGAGLLKGFPALAGPDPTATAAASSPTNAPG